MPPITQCTRLGWGCSKTAETREINFLLQSDKWSTGNSRMRMHARTHNTHAHSTLLFHDLKTCSPRDWFSRARAHKVKPRQGSGQNSLMGSCIQLVELKFSWRGPRLLPGVSFKAVMSLTSPEGCSLTLALVSSKFREQQTCQVFLLLQISDFIWMWVD